MDYSDISDDVNNRISKLEEFGLNKVLESAWLGFIIITNSGKVIIDSACDYENIGTGNIINLLSPIKMDLFDIKSGTILSIPQDGVNYNLIIKPIVKYDLYGVFFVSLSLNKQYSTNDIIIVDLLTNIGYENVHLNNEIAREKDYLQNIFDNTDSAIISINLQAKITKANKKAYDILEIQDEDITGYKFYKYVSENQMAILKKDISCTLCHKSSITYKNVIFKNKSGKKIILNITMSQLKHMSLLSNNQNQLEEIIFVANDVTNTKTLEKELEQVKQIDIMGDISAEIAHEIKNPLMGIKGCARILQKDMDESSRQYEFAESIVTEVSRANDAIEQFLSYERMNKEDNYAFVDINKVLENCSNLIYFYKEDKYIVVKKDLDKNLPCIKANVARLQQAFMNIIINAVQSIKSEGTITISTRYLERDKTVYVEILDNGMGISQNKLDKIFDPYFTTKSEGTGLGLSITEKIIKKNCGKIHVSSEENLWTKFQIIFPCKEMVYV